MTDIETMIAMLTNAKVPFVKRESRPNYYHSDPVPAADGILLDLRDRAGDMRGIEDVGFRFTLDGKLEYFYCDPMID